MQATNVPRITYLPRSPRHSQNTIIGDRIIKGFNEHLEVDFTEVTMLRMQIFADDGMYFYGMGRSLLPPRLKKQTKWPDSY